MKIKANQKFSNLEPQAIPCDVSIRKSLQKGKVVDVSKKVAESLLAINIVDKISNKKSKENK